MIKIYEAKAIDDIIELPYSPDEEGTEQGFATNNPTTILKAINRLEPGEYVIIQNISPARSGLTEYYCRKEARHINLL